MQGTRKEIQEKKHISRSTFIRWIKKGKIRKSTPNVPIYELIESHKNSPSRV